MRGLTTRNVRPCLQHKNFSFSAPSIRRTTFPPLQRAITCADAFLLFLPSVLTAALVVDYNGKERKRAEWDHQIALAQEEADRLKQRQLESWSRIQRRSVSHGAWQQRRTLFTASRQCRYIDEERESMMDPLDKMDEINASDGDAHDYSDPHAEPPKDLTTDEYIKKQERFSRLIATRLALELMLRLRRARSPLYKPQPTVDTTDKTFYQSMDYIVQELNKVLQFIQAMEIQNVPWEIEMPIEYHIKQKEMGRRLLALSDRYRAADIHLPDYVMSYVQLVTDYKIGPPNWGYVVMMRSLAYKQEESRMARHVEDAIFDNHEFLDSYTTSNVLYHYGSVFDSLRFNQFLQRITTADQHPRSLVPWHRLNIDDIEICVPKSKNGHIITSLIRTALICRQQPVAEAYATLFIDRDRIEKYSGIHKWFVLGSFLQTYGEWKSWKAGRKWLQTVLDWISDLNTVDEHVLGRVILRMLDFCVACGKKDDYEAIMGAVVAAHLQLPVVESDKKLKISERMGAIRLDWANRIKTLIDFDPMGRDLERAEKFKSVLSGRWSPQDESNVETPKRSKPKWSEGGTLPYNPILALERLEEASRQRQSKINHGFKILSPEPKWAPALELVDQDPLREESVHEDISSDSRSETFDSPFFQQPFYEPPLQESDLLSDNSETNTTSNFKSDPDVISDSSPPRSSSFSSSDNSETDTISSFASDNDTILGSNPLSSSGLGSRSSSDFFSEFDLNSTKPKKEPGPIKPKKGLKLPKLQEDLDSTELLEHLDVKKLAEDLKATKRRLKEVEKQKAKELAQLKRDLEAAQAQLRQVQGVSTVKPLYDDDEWIRSSATG